MLQLSQMPGDGAGGMSMGSGDKRMKMLRLFSRSEAMRGIIERRPEIENALCGKKRRVWPLATVARLFGISPSLLRKWAKQGMVSLFKRPSDRHRPGLTAKAVRKFLGELAAAAESRMEFFPHRPRPAEQRCHDVVGGLKPGEVLAPAEFAARAKVAVTTVRRLLAMRELHAWYPTPHRPKVCDWGEEKRRNRLTKKKTKNGP